MWTLFSTAVAPNSIGRAVDRAALHAAAGEPDAERLVVVIAARIVVAVAVAGRGAAEFAAPDDQRAVEQAALLQVGEQRGGGRVDFGGACRQAVFDVLVMIPAAGPDLHEAHAALDEAARDQQLSSLRRVAVQRADALRLLLPDRTRRWLRSASDTPSRTPRCAPRAAGPFADSGCASRSASAPDRARAAAPARPKYSLRMFWIIPSTVGVAVLMLVACRSPGRNAEPQFSAPAGPPPGRSEM